MSKDQLDELSAATKKSYVKKAKKSYTDNNRNRKEYKADAADARSYGGSGGGEARLAREAKKSMDNRKAGIKRATEALEYMDDDELNEVSASMGDVSMANDPVNPAGGSPKGKNRKADLNKSVDPKADEIEDDVKTPQGSAKVSKAPPRRADAKAVKEAVDEMFDGQDLSEDFKTKASVVVEAVVNSKIEEELARLEEEFQTNLEEQTTTAISELAETISNYMDYVVEGWIEDNKIEIDRGIKAEIAESFIAGLKDLFVENNVDIPVEAIDVVEELSVELEEVKAKLNEALNETIDLKKSLSEAAIENTFDEIAEGLTTTQKEKLQTLSENIAFEDLDEYKKKVQIIKENYFSDGKSRSLTESLDTGNQEIDGEEILTHTDPMMARYVNTIDQLNK